MQHKQHNTELPRPNHELNLMDPALEISIYPALEKHSNDGLLAAINVTEKKLLLFDNHPETILKLSQLSPANWCISRIFYIQNPYTKKFTYLLDHVEGLRGLDFNNLATKEAKQLMVQAISQFEHVKCDLMPKVRIIRQLLGKELKVQMAILEMSITQKEILNAEWRGFFYKALVKTVSSADDQRSLTDLLNLYGEYLQSTEAEVDRRNKHDYDSRVRMNNQSMKKPYQPIWTFSTWLAEKRPFAFKPSQDALSDALHEEKHHPIDVPCDILPPPYTPPKDPSYSFAKLQLDFITEKIKTDPDIIGRNKKPGMFAQTVIILPDGKPKPVPNSIAEIYTLISANKDKISANPKVAIGLLKRIVAICTQELKTMTAGSENFNPAIIALFGTIIDSFIKLSMGLNEENIENAAVAVGSPKSEPRPLGSGSFNGSAP